MKASDFIRTSMTNYGIYTCEDRAIPHFKDGLKPCVRRILYTYYKHFFGKEPKVADLAGRCMALHPHGDASLEGAISLAARQWAGANNHRLFDPTGAVGTRSLPEKKAIAAARYLSVKGSDFLKDIFYDDCSEVWKEIPNYDEKYTEIESFYPAIPLCLLNGDTGIGYGYSVNILPRKITDLKNVIESIIDKKNVDKNIQPHWRGFTGRVSQEDYNKWVTYGVVKEEKIVKKKRFVISDIPIDMSKGYVMDRLINLDIDFNDECDDNFRIVCNVKSISDIPEFKLSQNESIRVIDNDKGMVSYHSVYDYLVDFVGWRLSVYERSRQYWISNFRDKIHEYNSKLWAIRNNLFGMVINQPAEIIIGILKANNLHKSVLNISISEVSENNIRVLEKNLSDKQKELEKFLSTTKEKMYKDKLDDICKKHGY